MPLPGLGSTLSRVVLQHQSELLLISRAALGGFVLPQWGSTIVLGGTSCCCVRLLSSSTAGSTSSSSSSCNSSSSTSSSLASSRKGAPSAGSQPSNSASSTGPNPIAQQAARERSWQQELRAVRAHVFEHHVNDRQRNGRKAILKPLKGRYIADWYFTLTGPKMPMMVDDIEEERLARVELARATGGGPPKKGQGKRAKK